MRQGSLLLVLLAATACGSRFNPELYPTPQALFDAAKAAFERGDCGGATRGFNRVVFELPTRDPRVAEARYMLGECRVRDGDYLQASQDLRRVADEFPNHELASIALLRAADALARLWKRPELDPTYGEQALSTYSEVLSRFPQSEAAAHARERSAELTDRFALKELRTGDFYFRLRAFDSAIISYRLVVARYQESRHAPAALLKLVEIYHRIGYAEEAAETCEHLRRFYATHDGVADACPVPSAP